MTDLFVPDGFAPPRPMKASAYRLEPLGPEHNERDHAAWMSSIDHIRSTPGFEDHDWPTPMSLEDNLRDLEAHARDFEARTGFTYSILDGDDVVGCLYIYPMKRGPGAHVRSWVTAERADLDEVVWHDVTIWLAEAWPLEPVRYATRH